MAKKTPEWLNEGAGHVDITLSRPVEIAGVQTSTLRMREPTVRDQEAATEMKGSDASREIVMFANLCDVTPDEVRNLSIRDYKRLQTAFLGFTD